MLTHFNMLHLMYLMFLFHGTIITYIRINKIYLYMYLYVCLLTSVNVYKNVAFFKLI